MGEIAKEISSSLTVKNTALERKNDSNVDTLGVEHNPHEICTRRALQQRPTEDNTQPHST